jgi:flagellar biosynthesis protein FlhB
MSEQDDKSQERTEQATPKRRQDAKKKGQAPRSRELNTTAVLLTGAATLVLFGGTIGNGIAGIMTDSLSMPRELAFDAPLIPARVSVTRR